MNKRIDEISIIKGICILMVMISHISSASGLVELNKSLSGIFTFVVSIIMFVFFLISGYLLSIKNEPIHKAIGKKWKALLLPYYKFAIFEIVIYAIIYLLIEGKSFGWFLDGTLGILFQLQSFHLFDTSIQGVHPMFYSVLIGWYIFQFAVSLLIVIPLLYYLNEKNRDYKLISAFILLLFGAIFYSLNLQDLNGKFFPPVCKILIFPNVFGIAGVLMLGNFLKSMSILELDQHTLPDKISILLISVVFIVIRYATDDFLYDMPIGKWGALGSVGYFSEPLFGIAFLVLLGILSNSLKKIEPIKKVFIFFGDNSMDFLVTHFFVIFLTAWIGGFWYNYLSESIPVDNKGVVVSHFVILVVIVLAVCCGYTVIKKKICNKTETMKKPL